MSMLDGDDDIGDDIGMGGVDIVDEIIEEKLGAAGDIGEVLEERDKVGDKIGEIHDEVGGWEVEVEVYVEVEVGVGFSVNEHILLILPDCSDSE